MKKRLFAFSVLFMMIFRLIPAVSAESGAFLIMDPRGYAVLEEENGNARLPMASTTKIMTALIILESVDIAEVVRIPSGAVGVEGSSFYLKAGEEYTVAELLYALLLESANDCAVALALFAGNGDLYAFVERMNQKARSLDLKNTHFENPHGLSAENHYSSAYDLAKLFSVCMENSVFRKITATRQTVIHGRTASNHNRLLSLCDGCIGGKTGYTKKAGRCLVSAAEREGIPLICVTLGRSGDWEIHTEAYGKWFSALREEIAVEKQALNYSVPIAGGGTAQVTNPFAVSVYSFGSLPGIETVPELPRFLYGNKNAGDVVGTVTIYRNGCVLAESPLVLTGDIRVEEKKELFLTRIFRIIRQLFLKNGKKQVKI